jgi:PAS domain S-box-containing protein
MVSEQEPLQLLVLEQTRAEADSICDVLRRGGARVRCVHAEDEGMLLYQLAQEPAPGMVLCNIAVLSALRAVQAVAASGRDVPVIAVGERYDIAALTEVLRAGARDLVTTGHSQHLQLVVARELAALRQRDSAARWEQAFRETERRCHTLFETSTDAVAYVHEGMHIRANGAYLSLFGCGEEEIAGTPLMDMVETCDHGKLKEFLRSYVRSPEAGACVEVLALSGGAPLPVRLELAPASLDGEPCTQVVVRRLEAEPAPEEVCGAAPVEEASAPPLDFASELVRSLVDGASTTAVAGESSAAYEVSPEGGAARVQDDPEGWGLTIRRALDAGRLHFVYQPIVKLDGTPSGCYCVGLRLHSEDGEPSAEEFMAAADRLGLRAELDRWALRHAIDVIAEQHQRKRTVRLLLPVSVPALADPELPRWLSERIAAKGVRADSIVPMLAEQDLVEGFELCNQSLQAVNAGGVPLGLDGVSGDAAMLDLASRVPARYWRLSGALSERLAERESQQTRMQSVTEQARARGVRTIASQVDDARCMVVLWRLQVDYADGHFLRAAAPTLDACFPVR